MEGLGIEKEKKKPFNTTGNNFRIRPGTGLNYKK